MLLRKYYYPKHVVELIFGRMQYVREGLILAFDKNIIDETEFCLLYDAHKSKEIFPHWKFGDFDINTWENSECFIEMRFEISDLQRLADMLQIPEKFICPQRTVCSGIAVSLPFSLYRHGPTIWKKSV